MTIEQKIFSRRRFSTSALASYGFIKKGSGFCLSKEFMDGDFSAELIVVENGSLRGRVIDNMTGEEYLPLRLTNVNGAYVGTVREEYEKLLEEVAECCCTEVSFANDQSNRIAAAIYERYAVEPDFPWDEGKFKPAGVFRHGNNHKWFGLVMNIDRRLLDKCGGKERSEAEPVDVLNLKAEESKIKALTSISGIYPAYHMNHSKWISVTLDDKLADDDVMDLVEESFRLTSSGGGVLNERLIREVLEIADSIPSGKVMSYGQIAEKIGRPKNARLVGKIMSMADPYGEHPCHRVVNQAGRTVPGWKEQRPMLEAEGVIFKENGCVDMKKYRL